VPEPSTASDTDSRSTVPDFDRHARRGVWIAALCVLIGAAVVYASKAAEDRSAFVRWRKQVLEFVHGTNIYDKYFFPNPPLMPLSLYPLMALPTVAGALVWFWLKVFLAGLAAWMCLRMVQTPDVSPGDEVRSWLRNTKNLFRRMFLPSADIPPAEIPLRPIPSWVQATIIILSFRPILSDLHHGNNNILIMFLAVASLAAWRRGWDVLAGMILALSITYKVTPGLILVYYAYKGSWRAVVATLVGMAAFLFVVPSLFLGVQFKSLSLGTQFNLTCLNAWWRRILSPFVESDVAGVQEINQSMVGTIMRIFTEQHGEDRYAVQLKDLHLFSLNPRYVVLAVKAMSVGFLGLLAWLCRTKTDRRDDPRLLGEFSLIVLTMLFVSERSWKHHYVTLLLPFTYLSYRAFSPKLTKWARFGVWSALLLSGFLMATTSSEFGGLFFKKQGHKIAQFYGMFFWAGVVLFVATAWRVWVERGATTARVSSSGAARQIPAPHSKFATAGERARIGAS
jgi:alpha-1,2-mannosyltransferase